MDYLEPITNKLDEISTHYVLFYIFIAFTLMFLFFLLSLKYYFKFLLIRDL